VISWFPNVAAKRGVLEKICSGLKQLPRASVRLAAFALTSALFGCASESVAASQNPGPPFDALYAQIVDIGSGCGRILDQEATTHWLHDNQPIEIMIPGTMADALANRDASLVAHPYETIPPATPGGDRPIVLVVGVATNDELATADTFLSLNEINTVARASQGDVSLRLLQGRFRILRGAETLRRTRLLFTTLQSRAEDLPASMLLLGERGGSHFTMCFVNAALGLDEVSDAISLCIDATRGVVSNPGAVVSLPGAGDATQRVFEIRTLSTAEKEACRSMISP
jgi:hypothetical protein